MLTESIFTETFEEFPHLMDGDELYLDDDFLVISSDIELTQRINEALARSEFE